MPDTDVTIEPTYRKIELINVSNTLKNPDTGNKHLIVLLLLIISLGIGSFLYKKRESK